jgi:Zn-dependent protease with chaperone function
VKEHRAKYYDGASSTPTSVTLELDDGDRIHLHGLPEPRSYALGEIRVAPRLGDTTRSITFPDGAKCETDDHDALAELDRRSGKGRGYAFIHALESSWRSALAAAVTLVLLIVVSLKWGIPVLAERGAAAMPPALAYDLGKGTLAGLDRTLFEPSVLSDERQVQLEASFRRLSASYAELPLQLLFRRGVGPNAFALPDGSVVVTDELVALAKNDEEILSVLAHEVGHVHHRHGLRMALESSTVVLLVSTYFGDVTQLTTLSAALPGVYAQAHYSRAHEADADTFALLYLEKSGIPRKRFADILRSLQKAAGPELKGGFQYLSSHPPTAERIARFER